MMTPEKTHEAVITERTALPPSEPDFDEDHPNIVRGYDEVRNAESLIFKGAMHQLGTELVYSSHILKDNKHNEKLHALIDGYESATFILGVDIEPYDNLPAIAIDSLPALSAKEIKERFESDLHAAKQRVAQELLSTDETAEKLATVYGELNERRVAMTAQLESVQRDDVEQLIRSELSFIDTALSFNQKVDSSTDEAKEAEGKEEEKEEKYVEPSRSTFHQAVFNAIKAKHVSAIDGQLIDEMRATSDILTKQSHTREHTSKEFEGLKEALLKHRFALIAQKMDMSPKDFSTSLGATLYIQMEFMNNIIGILNRSEPALPSTADLEERINHLTSETMSPARGINLGIVKKLTNRAVELAKSAGF